MRFVAGTTDIATAGTEVLLSASADVGTTAKVLWVRFKGRPGNVGHVFIKQSTSISTTQGFTLENNDDTGLVLDFRAYGGSVLATSFYMDAANNGDDVDWALIVE